MATETRPRLYRCGGCGEEFGKDEVERRGHIVGFGSSLGHIVVEVYPESGPEQELCGPIFPARPAIKDVYMALIERCAFFCEHIDFSAEDGGGPVCATRSPDPKKWCVPCLNAAANKSHRKTARRAVEVLVWLCDLQNGPPLPTYEARWNATMSLARRIIAEEEEGFGVLGDPPEIAGVDGGDDGE